MHDKTPKNKLGKCKLRCYNKRDCNSILLSEQSFKKHRTQESHDSISPRLYTSPDLSHFTTQNLGSLNKHMRLEIKHKDFQIYTHMTHFEKPLMFKYKWTTRTDLDIKNKSKHQLKPSSTSKTPPKDQLGLL